jgi:hypothetical protein
MFFRTLRFVFSVALLSVLGAAVAEEVVPGPPQSAPGKSTSPLAGKRTGKERLGTKWMDEQRVDNCKVPPELRGSKPRPDECAN